MWPLFDDQFDDKLKPSCATENFVISSQVNVIRVELNLEASNSLSLSSSSNISKDRENTEILCELNNSTWATS